MFACPLASASAVASAFALAAVLAFGVAVPTLSAQHRAAFEFERGDRVVFVGDGFVERAQHFGYIERGLVTRWPDRLVTFRNVGWSGDNVRGEARDHYTNPPTPFEHLIEQITKPDPTVIFFGYGAAQAHEDAEDIPAFVKSYNQLHDALAVTGARCVMLAPIPHDPRTSPNPAVARINHRLRQTRDAVEEIAAARGCPFVDLFTTMASQFKESASPVTIDGIYLTAEGYQLIAAVIENRLATIGRTTALQVDIGAGSAEGGTLQGDVDASRAAYRFSILPDVLPADVEMGRVVRITGVPKGTYTLSSNGVALMSASASAWAKGVTVVHPVEQVQTEALRRLIVEKNELYFRQYRPLNETYLVGFRRYEQGQNAGELGQLDAIIDEKENEISRLAAPRALVFALTAK